MVIMTQGQRTDHESEAHKLTRRTSMVFKEPVNAGHPEATTSGVRLGRRSKDQGFPGYPN